MKKIIPILSFITALSSSLIVVSCKIDNTNQKIKEKDNKTESKETETKRPNSNSNSNEKELQKDQPITKEQKDEKIDTFAEKIKKEIEENISKKDKEKIKNYAAGIIDKMLKTSFQKDGQKRILELEEKISRLFTESNFDQIKTEINLLFSEAYEKSDLSSENVKKKITDILSKVDKKNKQDISEIVNDSLAKILEKQFNEESKKKISEIEELLNGDSLDKLKEKLFDWIKKTAESYKLALK
ncbi:lipoprotein [Mycoplasma mycoides]|uniref:lipoprotein n=1 Tax=Mycoplasma mycoides TaxID=2102 RepID=UPI00223FF86E|nr:lipoprotein [Mycoplasma mycoides]QVK03133.1 lipoprotein [Mycoplasma mycoides subsp. capri]QVK03949.1 lipoprotein [Mycoplasma mycoides subsp. capri]QVK05556.1 lipoprotein [Mycoplasma mycoides subsp. capri]